MKTDSRKRRLADDLGAKAPHLSRISNDLARLLVNTQKKLAHETLRLSRAEVKGLATALVEFAEDIHSNIGLWRSLEAYHQSFFGTPLPLIVPANTPLIQTDLYEKRVWFLLWNLYSEINPDLVLAPKHQDLQRLAETAADFLQERFARVSPESEIRQFLAQPNTFGWEVKRKLLWLGQRSFMFRYHFQNYLDRHGGQATIPVIDDFLCQHNTTWSGLGVIDILAAVLDTTEVQRAELRSWYERHLAYYKVIAITRSGMQVVNLINDKPYSIVMERPTDFFKVGQVIFGSLVPWRNEWYWSGEQQNFRELPANIVAELKQEFLEKRAVIAYRYCQEKAQQARTSGQNFYDRFVSYHGNDLVIFDDGLSMAASLQKMYRLYNEAAPPDILEKYKKTYDLSSAAPKMSYPPELIESKNGIGVFFNQAEGQEMMVEFYDVLSGLKKQGLDLSDDEEDAVRGLIYSEVISPAFVERLVRDYGSASIAAAFLIRNPENQPYLPYLLRRCKGHFYRKRYPALTLVE